MHKGEITGVENAYLAIICMDGRLRGLDLWRCFHVSRYANISRFGMYGKGYLNLDVWKIRKNVLRSKYKVCNFFISFAICNICML